MTRYRPAPVATPGPVDRAGSGNCAGPKPAQLTIVPAALRRRAGERKLRLAPGAPLARRVADFRPRQSFNASGGPASMT